MSRSGGGTPEARLEATAPPPWLEPLSKAIDVLQIYRPRWRPVGRRKRAPGAPPRTLSRDLRR